MEQKKVFRVAVIADLTEREWWVLSAASSLTTSRTRSYVFEPPSLNEPDMYLVDGDVQELLRQWRIALAKHNAPTVFLKANPERTQENWQFCRKIVPASLLKLVNLLDQVSIQKLHYLPELCIGEEDVSLDSGLAENVAPPQTRGSQYKALVVDDSATVRAQVGLALKIFGAKADFAENAAEAYKLLEKNSYDIAFLDIVLPDEDGYHICRAIKRNPKHKHIPAIMLTSKSSAIDRVKASLAGCNAFLTKPVQHEDFQQVLGKYLVDNAIGNIA